MTTATTTVTTACTACGRKTTDTGDWAIRGPEAVASGVRLGTCPACYRGKGRRSAVLDADEALPGLAAPTR